MKTVLAISCLLIYAPPGPPVAKATVTFKGEATTHVEYMPPVPAMARVQILTSPKVKDSADALVLWDVEPAEKILQVEKEDANEFTFLAPAAPETEFRYKWIVKERGKKQITDRGKVKAGKGPRPPPEPDPDPDPEPEPDPDDPVVTKNPFPGTSGLHVLVLYQDTEADLLTPAQRGLMHSEAARNYLDSKCPREGPRSWPAYRMYDVDVQMGNEEQVWKDAVAKAKEHVAAWKPKTKQTALGTVVEGATRPLPWLMIGMGERGFSGPVPPEKFDEVMALLKSFGG